MLHPLGFLFPPFRLVLRSGPVELRLPTEADLAELAAAVAAGGLADEQSRRALTWVCDDPAATARAVVTTVWTALGSHQPGSWLLPFVVTAGGRARGLQALLCRSPLSQVPVLGTWSWLTADARGRGLGKAARAGVLALAWELGAQEVRTGWFDDNEASARVSAALGYLTDGSELSWDARLEQTRRGVRAVVTRERFQASWSHPVDIVNLDAEVRVWLTGAAAPSRSQAEQGVRTSDNA